MKYMLLIYADPRRAWRGSDEDRAELRELLALKQRLAASGELVDAAALAPVTETRAVRARGPGPVVTDGPFAEAKEVLAGYFIVDCTGKERALEIAADNPAARDYVVELRPIVDDAVLWEAVSGSG